MTEKMLLVSTDTHLVLSWAEPGMYSTSWAGVSPRTWWIDLPSWWVMECRTLSAQALKGSAIFWSEV
jgi:hypothetical protein